MAQAPWGLEFWPARFVHESGVLVSKKEGKSQTYPYDAQHLKSLGDFFYFLGGYGVCSVILTFMSIMTIFQIFERSKP